MYFILFASSANRTTEDCVTVLVLFVSTPLRKLQPYQMNFKNVHGSQIECSFEPEN